MSELSQLTPPMAIMLLGAHPACTRAKIGVVSSPLPFSFAEIAQASSPGI